ncbi:MAG TPA: S8 family serine peptidase, partial [Nitrososphaeraceae archaeon]|nr:S8 family serine peptidase [Nitrososphaeraceae archaeon]
VDDQDQRHEIGTATADANGVWSTTIDPKDPNLGDGTFTLIATTQVGEGDPVDTNTIQVTIDCPPTLVGPEGTVTCGEGDFEVSGEFAGAGASIVVYVVDDQDQRHEIGTATADANGVWSTTIDPKDPNLGDGTFTLIATANGIDTNTIQVTIDCPPTLVGPEGTVTCGEGDFEVSGEFAGSGASIVVHVGTNSGPIVGTATADENGVWSTTIDPKDTNLGDGTFTLIATANGIDTNTIQVTIDCPAAPTTIDEPTDGTTIDCDQPLTLSGTFDSSTFSEVEIFVDGNSAGFAELNGDNWSFVVPAELLGEGSHIFVARASTGGSEPFTSESEPVTLTAECPPPPDGGGGGGTGGGGTGGGAAGGGAAGGGAAGSAAAGSSVTVVDRQIYQRPYAGLACTKSIVELKDDLIPTIPDFPAVVEEVKAKYNVTVLNVYNVPDFKAMLLADGDETKIDQDDRFVLAPAVCGELILEVDLQNEKNKGLLDNTMTMSQLADDVVAEYKIVWVDTIDIPDYKALVVLADPTNPVTKDPRFINYGEGYDLSSNHTGAGELDLSSGHVAAPPSKIEKQIVPDSIKRTFSAAELAEDSQSGGGKDIDVDIAILDTGVDLEHPDLNVYKNVNVIAANQTGDDDNGHGTHVAGIAAAKDNGIGVLGGAPGARIWSVKVCDGAGECKISNIIKGVEYVTQHADEIDVANISVETPLSPALNRAISASIKAGVTYVVAAGNYGHDAATTSPASNPDVITVSAIADSDGKCGGVGPAPDSKNTTDDSFAPFSNFGPSVTIAAPGVSVLSTYLNGEYAVDSGTSMAAPSVTAAAALLKANSTDITPKEIKQAIVEAGSNASTPCEGGPQGYFTGDPDSYKEPLLFRK